MSKERERKTDEAVADGDSPVAGVEDEVGREVAAEPVERVT